jgi:deazaflavin-dependent oxidoreductase (nitroreductase family)
MNAEFAEAGFVRRRVRLLVTTQPIARLSARLLPGLDRIAYRLSRGRLTPSAWITGLPVVQMTTTGARTGQPRTVRLLGVPHGDGFLVVAANFGDARNPAWYYNTLAHPRVTVTAGAPRGDYEVRELSGEERTAGFDRALLLNPGWSRFRQRAGSRSIPVLAVSPRPAVS